MASEATLRERAEALAQAMLRQGWRLACAESCSGGWIAKCLTDLPGSSAWFDGGVVSYSNAAKQRWLGVPEALLLEHGAVSAGVASAMAEGLIEVSGVDLAVAVTGVAGPDGGSPAKPVGTVWIAVASPGLPTRASRHAFAGDREAVRRATVAAALDALLEAAG